MKAELKKITPTGIKVFVIENDNGMRAELLSYGAIISKLFVKDRNGNLVDVVAGYENEDDYAGDICYFGALIGRVCNRTAGAKFSLDGVTYELAKNNGNNHLHGGAEGFNKKEYSAEIVGPASIKFSRISPNKEEGYPGTMTVAVTYTLTNDNALEIAYEATSDKRTPCALTNHSYFNLDGDFESVLDHEVFIDADKMSDIDEELIPTGKLLDVKGTPYDFRKPKRVGKDIGADDRLLHIANGYDFNFVLKDGGIDDVRATAYSEKSGILMQVYTTKPCIQFYTGNFLSGEKGKKVYEKQSALCLETQNFPNAVNMPSLQDVVLKAGELYRSKTKYKFSIK
ncbi:MAG: galactose mutarotase [Clostridia bacterium]|nr:galactose mutarotase [Clostridia bacterium]